MQQYLGVKERYMEEILFFRLGDFYEMFFEDAVRAAPILEVALTQRQSIPMCGVPFHAATTYIAKLLKAGLSVAIAEQLEDPKNTKGMVKRDVVRVMTPGTLVEDEFLSAKSNNFLVAIVGLDSRQKRSGMTSWALAAADVSTGAQWVGETEDDFHWNTLKSHLAGLNPSEVLIVGADPSVMGDLPVGRAVVRFVPTLPAAKNPSEQALKAIEWHLTRDMSQAVKSLQTPQPLPSQGVMFLDETAIRHLELIAPADANRANGTGRLSSPTLLSVLDTCVTAVGSRLLRWWILHPSLNLNEIQSRQKEVTFFVENTDARRDLRALLNGTADIERISVRAQAGTVSPRDLDSLRFTLRKLPEIAVILKEAKPTEEPQRSFTAFRMTALAVPLELPSLLESQLADEPPAKLNDGGVIRDGVNAELDELRTLRRSGKKWIAEMEAAERERTGIGSLKVGYNDIFGYYLEVSKTNLSKVPADWIRKQTMANGERYITPALKEQEEKILGAEDKILVLENRIYGELVRSVASYASSLRVIAATLAHLDVVAALGDVAVLNNFVCPRIVESNELQIKAGRHPVVEKQIGRDKFIPNETDLNTDGRRIAVITGPNMAGKSTYLRQTALISILGQMGSYVPAEDAKLGLVDKIFTRIGASDRLAQGQSTFMVEMQEVSSLIHNCTSQSLLILDEVGRGTSTYDGVSIAWAVIEHLSAVKPRALFATHYFELTQLENQLSGVFNAHATAKEWTTSDGTKQVVFLYQIQPGAADRSYGIHVADMAGLPRECVARAREILKQLESGDHRLHQAKSKKADAQLEFFSEHPIVTQLRDLKVEAMTPLEALNALAKLKENLQ